jgi:hypothetical protein
LFVIDDLPLSDLTRRKLREAEAALSASVIRRREASLACARDLRRLVHVGDGAALTRHGCASVGELGERFGFSAQETRELLDLGDAFAHDAAFEDHVRKGSIPWQAGCVVARILGEPALLREGDDWIGWAQTESVRQLRRRVDRRLEERARPDVPLVPMRLFVTTKVRDDFQRATRIASRKAQRAISQGTAFGVIVDHYLNSFDHARVNAGTRRLGDTSSIESRYVPAQVRREVQDRQQGRCAVPFCDHDTFLDFAHLVPHALRGSREADNLVLLCGRHHGMLDSGLLRLEGTAAHPEFRDLCGNDLSKRFQATDPSSEEADCDRFNAAQRALEAGRREREGEPPAETGPPPETGPPDAGAP